MQKNLSDYRTQVVLHARDRIGKSTYRRAATLSDAPQVFNCYRFTQWAWAQVGLIIPDHQLVWPGFTAIDVSAIGIADLVFIPRLEYSVANDDFGHVGIATGYGTVIHATKWRNNVVEDALSVFLERGCLGVRRVPACR